MEKVKILVVDDESRMRKLVRDFLTRQNYEVLEAADGEEALDIFYKDKAGKKQGYLFTNYSGCDDAKDERLGSLQGNPSDIQSPDHHAYGQK